MALRHQVILDEPHRENRFPMLLNEGDGRLLLIFSTSPARPQRRHMDIAMEMRMMRSTDDGQTWSPPELLITHNGQVSPTHPPAGEGKEPALIVPYFHWVVVPQGERGALGTRIPQASTASFRQDPYYGVVGAIEGVYITRSLDGGASWCHRIRVNTEPFLWAGTRDLPARTLGGRLLLPLYGRRPQDKADVAFVVWSDDEGCTWSEPIVIAADPAGQIEYQEPAMLALSDKPSVVTASGIVDARGALPTTLGKHIIATYRIDRHKQVPGTEDDDIFCNESKDGGKTWTQPRSIGVWGHPTHMIQLQDGAVVCVYGYRRPPYGIRAVMSEDDGATWLVDHELILRDDGACSDPGKPATDIGYPFVTQLTDGTLMAVYYFDVGKGQRFLAATYFAVEDF